jgi:DNA helicase II / ATP-dependent DNA helicase PcrA
MNLTVEQQRIVEEETSTLRGVLDSLQRQVNHHAVRLKSETERARELTSSLVAARRVEDKQMLASDEAVSHALKDRKEEELQTLGKLLDNPYFARMVIEEEDLDGELTQREYRIGFQANLDCRIIDWRKAPLAKLYYHYKEGDDFSEEIQGRERSGRIVVRNRLDIAKGELCRISCRFGELARERGTWKQLGARMRARSDTSYSQLPPVLSLITAEQFRAITEDAATAVLIQGIAGSGKTTVALHRLSWLLHSGETDLRPDECAIVVMSPSLARYISNSLAQLQIEQVKTFTFSEWCAHSLSGLEGKVDRVRPLGDPCPTSIDRVKRSMALLRAVEEWVLGIKDERARATLVDRATSSFRDALDHVLLEVLSAPRTIIELDETKLIDRDLVDRTRDRVRVNREQGVRDTADDALALRLAQLLFGSITLPSGARGRYRHIVIDEVQDCSSSQLAALLGAVENTKDLTLVGDVAQNLDETSAFPGWEKLMQHWNFGVSMSRYLSLEVSHRSTLPIMKLADHIQERNVVKEGRAGRVPIWFRCGRENRGVTSVIEWLGRALERYPGALTAVLCRTKQEAKYAYSLLRPTFGESVTLGDDHAFSLEQGILVSEVRQVKGLEFCNVLLWNPSKKSYTRNELDRNLLYVAITRAEENLCIVTWERASDLLPPPHSNLLRCLDLRREEDEDG